MKKVIIGYIFNEENLTKDEKIFLDLAKKKNIEMVMINTSKKLDEKELEEKIKRCDIFYKGQS